MKLIQSLSILLIGVCSFLLMIRFENVYTASLAALIEGMVAGVIGFYLPYITEENLKLK